MSGNTFYTRTEGRPQPPRDPNFPRFHYADVEDYIATAKEGRPIFTQQERVQIIMPGSPHSPVEVVNDGHRERWPEQYKAFKRGSEMATDGTPIEQWSILARNQVLEMKAIGLHTVEQCAGMSDLACQKIGMAGTRIRNLAIAYLDDAKAQSITSEALARAEAAESRLASLEEQVAQSRQLMDSMHTELMRYKNAPPAIETYVPGLHDPMQGAPMPSGQPVATSSLDALAAVRRGPGRPRKEAA